jgi:hypothetical protein
VGAERSEVHAQSARVLPQRRDRIRARLAGSDRRDHERDSVFGYVQQERRRRGVEQLRVVNSDDYLPARRLLAEHVH